MYISNPNTAYIIAIVQQLAPNSKEVISMYWGEKSVIDYDQLVQALNDLNIRFFGGIFPGIINGTDNYESGVIVQKHSSTNDIFVIRDLKQKSYEEVTSSIPSKGGRTALVLVDGLSADIAAFLSNLYDSVGNVVDYIGEERAP